MKIIEIKEDKLDNLCEFTEKGLRYMGKAMQCLDEMKNGSYGERYGMRNYDDDEEEYSEMGMRGGRYGMRRGGRYGRY